MSKQLAASLVLVSALSSAYGADTETAVVFGQIRLGGSEPLALAYRLTAREVSSGKLVRIELDAHDSGGVLYDFGKAIPPGKYYFYSMVAPNSDADYRIGDAKNAFEVPPGATVYLGTWTITLGIPTTKYTIDYDMAEIGLFAKSNPSRDTAKFMIGAPGKAAIPLKTQ